MRVMYQQPHLVPPMKLTVFDDLPPTPTPALPSRITQWVSQGKVSLRSSLSIRRPTPSRLLISSPRPPLPSDESLPFRRLAQDFRPLELSIYMPDNRLSDLPEFDRLSFTEVGEIKPPPRALVRTKSEEVISNKLSMFPAPVKHASMMERSRMSHVRPDISSTVISTSRPPSEYDALHSHPVSWASFPGLPPQAHIPGRSEPSVTVLTPMQEEFSPPNTSVTVGGVLLEFPKAIDQPTVSPAQPELGSPAAEATAPYVPSALARNFSKPTDTNDATGYFHPNFQTQKRISQWLAHRQSSSISTTKTSSSASASSFAEHRRKRSQFYQLSAAPPKCLNLWPHHHHHHRTMTESTVASTVETDILSFENQSLTDTSVATPTDAQSRSLTVRNASKGLRPIMSGVPDIPPSYVEVLKEVDDVIIREIGGPLRSPGVGVAF
ncbi:hypothetical protein A1O3_10069 [Capronia epimyces CBS 606.96]|uniref:Uncharacterized protein n=1 Tax=Capronia epimyces CBS 606.96 TaxID=1182542 RepID=W9X8X6_9EURO|nr:uncharacterized protein A1O3_10069 [Capronia epimyces CBS 606.96]EXJ76912.1 hypothetical protein A1O3_10069 [Capronia epimyces CBS 606.96]